jgi:hypothetical protein
VTFFQNRDVQLTQNSRQIVDQAAAAAMSNAAQLVQIAGPSNKVAPGYDPSLAEPRIRAVEQALVEDGVSKDRLVRAALTTTDLNLKADPSGAQRVEIRLVARP